MMIQVKKIKYKICNMEEYEDIYHPTNTTTLCVEEKREKKEIKKGEYKKKIKTENGNKTIKIYESSLCGKIRNAVSGMYYDYKVGSNDEYNFFSVIMATGEYNTKTGILLFYNHPEEYEEHFCNKLKDDIKIKWYNRQIKNV